MAAPGTSRYDKNLARRAFKRGEQGQNIGMMAQGLTGLTGLMNHLADRRRAMNYEQDQSQLLANFLTGGGQQQMAAPMAQAPTQPPISPMMGQPAGAFSSPVGQGVTAPQAMPAQQMAQPDFSGMDRKTMLGAVGAMQDRASQVRQTRKDEIAAVNAMLAQEQQMQAMRDAEADQDGAPHLVELSNMVNKSMAPRALYDQLGPKTQMTPEQHMQLQKVVGEREKSLQGMAQDQQRRLAGIEDDIDNAGSQLRILSGRTALDFSDVNQIQFAQAVLGSESDIIPDDVKASVQQLLGSDNLEARQAAIDQMRTFWQSRLQTLTQARLGEKLGRKPSFDEANLYDTLSGYQFGVNDAKQLWRAIQGTTPKMDRQIMRDPEMQAFIGTLGDVADGAPAPPQFQDKSTFYVMRLMQMLEGG